MLLALSGKMRSGKDTAADVLVDKYGFTKVSFAAPLKEICAAAFDININYFYNDELKDANFKEPLKGTALNGVKLVVQVRERGVEVSDDIATKVIDVIIDKKFLTPRSLLQYIGTDVGRKIIKDSIWIDINKHLVSKVEGSVVVPDCRFANEVESVREQGGTVGIVLRPNLEITSLANLHDSETSITDTDDFDIVLINDGTLGSFTEQVELWYSLKRVV